MPVTINTLILAKADFYFYMHRDVYDQAVILADRYPELAELQVLVGGSDINREAVEWFYTEAPKPLHILAPYLSLIEGKVERDLEICCGVLHIITAMIHVKSFITKPQEVRKSVSFSLSIQEEYEMAWDRFFATAIPYEQRQMVFQPLQRVEMDAVPQEQPATPPNSHSSPNIQNVTSTARLEGFSSVREEEGEASVDQEGRVSSKGERKATRQLLEM